MDESELRKKYSPFSKDELVWKVIELEQEFRNYTKESRELEDFLEAELQDASQQVERYKSQTSVQTEELLRLRTEARELNAEINGLHVAKRELQQTYETKTAELAKRLTESEIQNDSMESKLRILQSRLDTEQERANDALERMALMENDLVIAKAQSQETAKLNNKLRRALKTKEEEVFSLTQRCEKLEKITKLVTVNRNELKVAKFQTPPVVLDPSMKENAPLGSLAGSK